MKFCWMPDLLKSAPRMQEGRRFRMTVGGMFCVVADMRPFQDQILNAGVYS